MPLEHEGGTFTYMRWLATLVLLLVLVWLYKAYGIAVFGTLIAAAILAWYHGQRVQVRETARRQGRPPVGVLSLSGLSEISISSEAQLRNALVDIDRVVDGGTVTLSEGPNHYIKATRHGDFWTVRLHTGSISYSPYFDTGSDSLNSERWVRASRARSIRQRITDERAPLLTTEDVASLFKAYLLGSAYPLPELNEGA
ncbi:hypothetical protein [Sphingosinicella sp. BN140058]|uniref:hypothetical protein n=1 Tax=Sphingosinicella sp. BN140058 TaxID=1892855 RepID=UPI001010F831|nr:hypothetical protein [Sphingosinicella sp. BN140058]QAY75823.1 hypothetical protein ETR14_04210 [Sphingosinicella sp. BN140058]